MSIHPYFSVSEGKINEFRELCERFLSLTAQETKCLYYGFSFDGSNVYCREAYEDAGALLEHLANVDAVLNEALKISQISRLEIHGVAEELAKLKEPLAALAPTYFTLEYGIRRLS